MCYLAAIMPIIIMLPNYLFFSASFSSFSTSTSSLLLYFFPFFSESISVKFKNTEMVIKPRIFSYTKEEEILFAALPVGTKNTVEDVYRKTLRSSGVTAKYSIAGVKDELAEIDLVRTIKHLVDHSCCINCP